MDSRQLQHMYQAWIQGNTDYIGDWQKFAVWAASFNINTAEEILEHLKNCHWAKMKKD